MFLHNIHTKQLQKHLEENDLVPWQYDLTGRAPATTYSYTYPYEITCDAVHFIHNYAEVLEILQPAARGGGAVYPPIYLPASQNYTIVHSKYVEACLAKNSHMRYWMYKSFVSVWQRYLPDIVFMTPRSDVCTTCEKFRIQIRDATHEEDKMELSERFASHVELAQKEREYYLTSMKEAEA